ncbi:MAG: zinc ABC transporter substrate-binding protein [Spirochaetales bacterium]|nr:zinc ABC transporter substrate-binding protein [Spirochaetales bacterium]
MRGLIIFSALLLLISGACSKSPSIPNKEPVSDATPISKEYHPFNTVVTTDYINELIFQFARSRTRGRAIIPRGSDPFNYIPSEQDKEDILKADLVFYNGLGLEPHFDDIMKKASKTARVIDLSQAVPKEKLIASKNYPKGYDPHYFKDPDIWVYVVKKVVDVLSEIDPQGMFNYGSIYLRYGEALSLHDLRYVKPWSDRLSPSTRYLITLHDSFQYFGKRYQFETHSLLSPGEEVVDENKLDQLALLIAEKKIPVIFYEESYDTSQIKSLQQKLNEYGWEVRMAGPLYSYFMAPMSDPNFSYIAAGRHEIQLIYENLKTEDMADIPQ